MTPRLDTNASASPPAIRVITGATPEDRREFVFQNTFSIGRSDECEVCIKDEHVSRKHVQVAFDNGQWWVRDLNSSNGIFVAGQRVAAVPVTETTEVRLGIYGPVVSLASERPQPASAPPPAPPGTETIVSRYAAHYFGTGVAGETAGEHTMMVRRAFQRVQKKQKRRYAWILGSLGVALLAAAGIAVYEHRQAAKQRAMAQDLFYAMKSLDVDIANFEKVVADSGNQQGMEEVRRYRRRRQEMEHSYDRYLAAMHTYDPKQTPEDRLILRVARIFGECELAMPPEFATEIRAYIKKWQSSGRLVRGIRTAAQNGYTSAIAREMLEAGLPPQFFYLALQESDFDPYISGPMTRKGIAKGMWQFIPETAAKYGLRLGPLIDLRRPDPADDRHHWDRETKAAVAYIKDLYRTDAQASGLLVMACYNWGEDYVLPLVRKLPPNPRDRNFWRLLALYHDKIPKETYDYVFYIASAAVIGENPRLFGFDFDDPLGHLESR